MRKLTYWIAEHLNDASCYSIRRRLRHEVITEVKGDRPWEYDKPRKVTIRYRDAFDLMFKLLREGGAE